MLKIPKIIHDRILEQARAEKPNECCGILAGRGATVEQLYPMTNSHHSPVTYMIDPKEQFTAFKDMRTRDIELLAIYHSHPDSPAYPSATDVRLAYYSEAVYMILSLQDPDHPVLNAYRIIENKITQEGLEIFAS